MDLGYCQLKGEVAGLPALGRCRAANCIMVQKSFPTGQQHGNQQSPLPGKTVNIYDFLLEPQLLER